jgi:hypothetical protein
MNNWGYATANYNYSSQYDSNQVIAESELPEEEEEEA